MRRLPRIPLTAWIGYPAPYQNDLMAAVAATGEVDLQVVFARRLPEERLQLGWQVAVDGYRHRFLTPGRQLAEATRLAWLHRRRVHLVNGLWMEPPFAAALVALAALGSRYLLFSEAPDTQIRRPPSVRLARRVLGTAVARQGTGVLAVSHFAVDYYRELGLPARGLYPFGYFRRGAEGQTLPPRRRRKNLDILYLGQLVHRKGLDILLEAAGPLLQRNAGVHLSIAGAGDLRTRLEDKVASAGLAGRVHLEGPVGSHEVLDRVGAADLLVLTSRWDGWGLVVNEALSMGVPVVVSNRCGAMDLVRHGVNGYVHPSADAAGLRDCLEAFVRLGKTERQAMCEAARRTGEQIEVRRAARYLVDCLGHALGSRAQPPLAPWLSG